MPLGLARDSMVNLAELAHRKDEEDENEELSTLGDGKVILEGSAVDGKPVLCIPVEGLSEKHQVQDDGGSGATDNDDGRERLNSVPDPSSSVCSSAKGDSAAQNTRVARTAPGASSNGTVVRPTNPPPDSPTLPNRQPTDLELNNSASTDGETSPNSVISTDQSGRLGTPAVSPSSTQKAASAVANGPFASRQQPSKPTAAKRPIAASYKQYEGFAMDYREYQHYTNYASYNTPTLIGRGAPSSTPTSAINKLICCIFPWTSSDDHDVDDEDGDEDDDVYERTDHNRQHTGMSVAAKGNRNVKGLATRDDDEVSTGSEVLGEKLSERERQAVLARLRMIQPGNSSIDDNAVAKLRGIATNKPGENRVIGSQHSMDESWNDSSTASLDLPAHMSNEKTGGRDQSYSDAGSCSTHTSTTTQKASSNLKGILRKTSTMLDTGKHRNEQSSSGHGQRKRRSLFPQYDTTPKVAKNLHVSFSPMARVVSVKSKNDMDNSEKSDIWWQKSDYEEFRKTGRMITRAMLQGGSEIWLASNQSWQMPNGNKQATLKHALSLAEKSRQFKNGNLAAKKEYESTRDKWWHAFGHSRRGLEHIASIDEGRQRQANVRNAIRAVLQEQRRQKVLQREDAEKLRMISIQYTSWARDLAIAAGQSDADAVKSKFNDSCRKSREFYLLKLARSNQTASSQSMQNTVPAFMKPILAIRPDRLDANAVSKIHYQQDQQTNIRIPIPQSVDDASAKKAMAAVAAVKSQAMALNGVSGNTSVASNASTDDEKAEPLHDDNSSISSKESMAKRAAGYASGEKVGNMSAVLSGMGPEAATVGGP